MNTFLSVLIEFFKKYLKAKFDHNLITMPANDCIFLPLQSQNKKTNWDKL